MGRGINSNWIEGGDNLELRQLIVNRQLVKAVCTFNKRRRIIIMYGLESYMIMIQTLRDS